MHAFLLPSDSCRFTPSPPQPVLHRVCIVLCLCDNSSGQQTLSRRHQFDIWEGMTERRQIMGFGTADIHYCVPTDLTMSKETLWPCFQLIIKQNPQKNTRSGFLCFKVYSLLLWFHPSTHLRTTYPGQVIGLYDFAVLLHWTMACFNHLQIFPTLIWREMC